MIKKKKKELKVKRKMKVEGKRYLSIHKERYNHKSIRGHVHTVKK